MQSKTLYIGENENIFERLDNENIELDKQSRQNIYSISKKQNNNYIGYYQFYSQRYYYKIFIIPKILLDQKVSDSELQKLFIDFFKQYYLLKIKYGDKVSIKDLDGNIADMLLDEDFLESSLNMDDFLYLKYIDALQTIKKFFQKHKRQKYINRSFSAQSIHHKIDLQSNIRSIDKSIIHQIKKEPLFYSKLAAITLSVLKVFKRNKLISTHFYKEIGVLTLSNLNTIQKRFTFDRKFSVSYKELLTHKTSKLFAKNKEHKKLYQSLLILLGLEHFENGPDTGKSKKIENMISIFFNPADLYEWVVYDYLETKYPNKVLKDGLHSESKQKYFLRNSLSMKVKKSSNPDFIIQDEADGSIVVDAKWKTPEIFTNIHYEDVAKLKRDCKLRGIHNALLIYPKLPLGYEEAWHFDDDISFTFKLEVCEIMHRIISNSGVRRKEETE